MLPKIPPVLKPSEGLEIIRAAATQTIQAIEDDEGDGPLQVVPSVLKRMRNEYQLDLYEVLEALEVVDSTDLKRSPEGADWFPDCDIYSFILRGFDDDFGERAFFTHVAVNYKTRDAAVVASWKLDGSPA